MSETGLNDRRKWLALGVLGLALAITVLDVTVVNVTIPAIQRDLNATLRDVEWISALYALVYGAFILPWGKLSDQHGRRRVFIGGVILFVGGSLLVGVAPSVGVLLVGRLIQGFGAAMAAPSTLSILSATFTGRARGVAFGIWGATAGAAGALGPLLGGYLTTYATWRWAFLINVPIGVVAVVGALLVVPESRDPQARGRLDGLGVLWSALGLGALIFGLIEGQTYGWLRAGETFAIGGVSWPFHAVAITPVAFAVAVVALAAFVVHELRLERAGGVPLFPLTLFRHHSFRYGLITATIVTLGEFGVLLIFSIYLQVVRGLSAFHTGLLFLPFSFAIFFTAPLAGLLATRFGPKWVVTAGMTGEALGIFLLGRITRTGTPFTAYIPIFILYGAAVGLTIAQLTNTVLSDIPRRFAGVGSGANNTARQVGAAIGIAVLVAVFAAQLASSGQAALARSRAVPASVKPAIAAALNRGVSAGEQQQLPAGTQRTPAGHAIAGIFDDAIAHGTRSAANVAAAFVFVGALSSLLIPNIPLQETAEADAGAGEEAEDVEGAVFTG
ncbi:MAG TPA: MFS transporter [Thermomicrobiaceae bacterium]|nr:MFS transporter [Thermomicrobiaceae bacterium]